jgi:hypothetical protein
MRTITTKRKMVGRCPIFTTKPTWKVGRISLHYFWVVG